MIATAFALASAFMGLVAAAPLPYSVSRINAPPFRMEVYPSCQQSSSCTGGGCDMMNSTVSASYIPMSSYNGTFNSTSGCYGSDCGSNSTMVSNCMGNCSNSTLYNSTMIGDCMGSSCFNLTLYNSTMLGNCMGGDCSNSSMYSSSVSTCVFSSDSCCC
jgi:hypothetical protein